MSYRQIIDNLNVSNIAVKVAFDELSLPFECVDQDPERYGCLPAMIPIWREDIDYIGYWKHCFTSKRKLTMCRQYTERQYHCYEYARSIEQLLLMECLRQLGCFDEVDDCFKDKMSKVGIIVTDEMLDDYLEVGIEEEELIDLPLFKNNIPLICNPENYQGDFPNKDIVLDAEVLKNICTVECNGDLREKLADCEVAPPWFKTDDQVPLFYKLLGAENLIGAWMCLNSNGWNFEDAKVAILQLADIAGDKNFRLLAETWAAQEHERYGEY